MGEILQAVRRVTDIMGEIAAASEEQSTGIAQVGRAVTQMDEVTQQNAALVEQAAAAAASLQDQAAQLRTALGAFRVSETGSGGFRAAVAVTPVAGGPKKVMPKLAPKAPKAITQVAATPDFGVRTARPARTEPALLKAPTRASAPTAVTDTPGGDWTAF